jgi:uncharacterized delta-60 repeat protein
MIAKSLFISGLIALIALAFVPRALAQQPDDADSSFNSGINGSVNSIHVDKEGKIWVAGQFTIPGSVELKGVARLLPIGSVDTNFSCPTIKWEINDLDFTQAGEVIIAGYLFEINGQPRKGLAKLKSDGSFDPAFAPTFTLAGGGSLWTVAVQRDDKILVGGSFTAVDDQPRNHLVRLNPDGSVDPSFQTGTGFHGDLAVSTIELSAENKILVGGDFWQFNELALHSLIRLNSNGEWDGSNVPNFDGRVAKIIQLSSGTLVIAGWFDHVNLVSRRSIARVFGTGELDTSFDPGKGFQSKWMVENGEYRGGYVADVAVQQDGKIIVGGSFDYAGGREQRNLARLNPNGDFDVTFTPLVPETRAVAVQSDGKILVGGLGGLARFVGGDPPPAIPAITILPTPVSVVAGADLTIVAIVEGFPLPQLQWQRNGTALLGETNESLRLKSISPIDSGEYKLLAKNSIGTSLSSAAVVQVSPAPSGPGTLDLSFRWDSPGALVDTIALQPDGKILVSGLVGPIIQPPTTRRSGLLRLNPDGTPDASFPFVPIFTMNAIAIQPDGKILVGGWFFEIGGEQKATIARINSDGSIDPTFNPGTGASYTIGKIAVQPDGRVLIAGEFTSFNGVPRVSVARLNPNGSIDPTFEPKGLNGAREIGMQSDGKILVGGSFAVEPGVATQWISRLNSDGSIDAAFQSPFTPLSSAFVGGIQTIDVQIDGKIVVGGNAGEGILTNRVLRLNPDGTLDANFHSSAVGSFVERIAIQNDGRIIIGGYFTNVAAAGINRIGRLDSQGSIDTTFQIGSGANEWVRSLRIQPDGGVLIGGYFTEVDGRPRSGLARLNNSISSGAGSISLTASATEYAEQEAEIVLTVKRQGPAHGATSVNFAVGADSSASLDSDYQVTPTILNWADGDTTERTINIRIFADEIAEGNEQIRLNLAIPVGGSIVGSLGQIVITIRDDDAAINFAQSAYFAREGQTVVPISVRRIGDVSTTHSVDFRSIPGSARAGADYVHQQNSIVFQPGETNKVIHLQLVDDLEPELPEAMCVELVNTSVGAYLNPKPFTSVTIADDDFPGALASVLVTAELGISRLLEVSSGRILGVVEPRGNVFAPIILLNRDGSFEFPFQSLSSLQAPISGLAVRGDGFVNLGLKYDFGGSFRSLYKIGLDGSVSEFGPTNLSADIDFLRVAAGDILYVAGSIRCADCPEVGSALIRLKPDGNRDETFRPPKLIPHSLAEALIQTDGKIVLAGNFSTAQGAAANAIMRIAHDGSIDETFQANIEQDFADPFVAAAVIQADGKLIIAGRFSRASGHSVRGLARLNTDGSMDDSFNPPAAPLVDGHEIQLNTSSPVIRLQKDGSIIALGGYYSRVEIGDDVFDVQKSTVVRLFPDGTIDRQFIPDPDIWNVKDVLICTNSEILVAGRIVRPTETASVARLKNPEVFAVRRMWIQPATGLKLELSVNVEDDYVLERSENLIDWQAVKTIHLLPGSSELSDESAFPFSAFYRLHRN